MRVVLDANVYISGLVYGGRPFALLELSATGRIALVLSEPIYIEIERILRDRFHWPADKVDEVYQLYWSSAMWVSPITPSTACSDPDDNRYIEAATAARAEYLVSGDKHLLTLKRAGSCRILTVTAMLEILGAR